MSTIYYDRTTSSGYRFPPARPHTTVGVRTSDHEQPSYPAAASKTPGTRVDTAPQRRSAAAGGVRSATAIPGGMDAVTQDRVWTNTILNARRRDRLWETQWGFTLELDPKGEPKQRKTLPEKVSIYSDSTPNTDGASYGSRLNTDCARRIQNLETRFCSNNKKRKIGSDLICY